MSLFSVYEKVQKLKRDNLAVFNGVDYAHVIAALIYDESLRSILKILFLSTFFSAKVHVFGGRGEVLVFYSCRAKGRKDYDGMVEKFREVIGSGEGYAEYTERFDLFQMFRTLHGVSSSFSAVKDYHSSLWFRIAMALLISKYRSSSKTVEALLVGRKILVTFCDAMPPDNQLAQIASCKGLRTITMQHGQYRLLGEKNMSADAEAYENFVSHEMFCWGRATQEQFVEAGYSRESMRIVGWVRDWSEGISPHNGFKSGVFGVMLNGENGKISNFNLVEVAKILAKNLGMKFVVRLHPGSTPDEYSGLVGENCILIDKISLEDYVKRVDFSLSHMSGALVEVLRYGAPVYLLDDGHLAKIFQLEGLSYSSPDAIQSALEEDRANYLACSERFFRFYRWFNDDYEQNSRILAVIGFNGR